MHTDHKHLSSAAGKAQSEYRPSRGGDPLDRVSLNGDCVRNTEGEEIGHIEGVMLDGSRDRIMYAVLSFRGSLGQGGRLFAVPWSVLRVEPDEACVVLDVPRERLRAAPGFGRDSWPSITDRSWRDEVDAYYRVRARRK